MNEINHQLDKAILRRQLLQQRKSMSVVDWENKCDRITTHLQHSPLFTQAKTILAYFSFRQEPDLSNLFTNTKYRWGMPRCVEKSLCWHLWKTSDALETGAYGILEPHPNLPTLEPAEVDLILIPAVACDYRGYRLGYGGGYYDRLLSSPEWEHKPTIGIVFDFAYLPELPVEPWDKPLLAVCTESGLKVKV
jgi:5-formyltetrahydrofolate cyclo-ligase